MKEEKIIYTSIFLYYNLYQQQMYSVNNKCHKYKTSQMKIDYKNIFAI